MSFRSAGFLILSIFAVACSRRPVGPAVQKWAVLRFENLGPDPSTDWMGRAFAEILISELGGFPGRTVISSGRLHTLAAGFGVRPASTPGISSERSLAVAAGANRIVYGDYTVRNGRVDVQATIGDPASSRTVRVLSASAADVYGAATALASQISSSVRPYPTRNAEAVRAYSIALESEPGQAIPQLEAAIASDPNFGPAYELLGQFRAEQKDRAGAEAILETALGKGDSIEAGDRARIQLELASLRSDSSARLKALTELAGLTPQDAAVWHSLGDGRIVEHDYAGAAAAYRKAVDLEGGDIAAWNQLGYALAYGGNLQAGLNALRRYEALRPADPNPIDSMGDLNLLNGHLKEAERLYLEAEKKNPAPLNHGDLFKAAMAHLMTGDIPGADTLASRYTAAREASHDPQAPLFRAEWDWISGRRRQACQEMERLARTTTAPLAARAYTEAALWYLMLGDRPAAVRSVQEAQPPGAAAIPRFLLQSPVPPDGWIRRGAEMIPNESAAVLRDTTVSTALLLNKEFAGALPVLRKLYRNPSSGTDAAVPIALAWALIEIGNTGEAAPLLRWNPIPQPGALSPLASIYFPRLYYLRAKLQGDTEEARNNYRLFLQLSGPDPLAWGEEQEARSALQSRTASVRRNP